MWPEEGNFPENLHCVVYVIRNKHSFESFMYLDLFWMSFFTHTHTEKQKGKLSSAKDQFRVSTTDAITGLFMYQTASTASREG